MVEECEVDGAFGYCCSVFDISFRGNGMRFAGVE